VAWKHLPDGVEGVRAAVTRGRAHVGGGTADTAGEDAAQELDVSRPVRQGSSTLTAEALDEDGKPVGAGFLRSFAAG
jgi:hypothetical protein